MPIPFTRTQTPKFPTSTSFPTYDTLVFQTCSTNLSISPAMATSDPPDEVERAASVAHSQGQPPLEPIIENATQQGTSVLDTSDPTTHNRMTSETLGTFCNSYSELDIEFSSSSVNLSFPKRRERTTSSSSERPLEAPTTIVKEGTMSEYSSLCGTRLDGSAASIYEHDLPNELPPHGNVLIPKDTASHQPTPSKFTGELHADANIIAPAVSTGTGEQSSRKCLLKGKSHFFFFCVSACPHRAI